MATIFATLVLITCWIIARWWINAEPPEFDDWPDWRAITDPAEKMAAMLMFKCNLCNAEGDAHRIAMVSSLPNTDTARSARLLESLHQERWDEIRNWIEFDVMQDNFTVFVLDCPEGHKAWFLTMDPFDLYVDARIVTWNKMSTEHAQTFKDAFAGSDIVWHEFSSRA